MLRQWSIVLIIKWSFVQYQCSVTIGSSAGWVTGSQVSNCQEWVPTDTSWQFCAKRTSPVINIFHNEHFLFECLVINLNSYHWTQHAPVQQVIFIEVSPLHNVTTCLVSCTLPRPPTIIQPEAVFVGCVYVLCIHPLKPGRMMPLRYK